MKGRAQKEHERAAAEPPLAAVINEGFKPDRVNVIAPEPGQAGNLVLQLLVGQVAPNTFLHGKAVELDPDAAISVGEYLVAEGTRLKTGLVTGAAILGADGRAVDLRG